MEIYSCRTKSVSGDLWSPLPLGAEMSRQRLQHWDHFTAKPVFNSPNSPKIAGAQSFTTRIKKSPKYGFVAGRVKEQQSRWELFLKNIYFCNGLIALTPKPHSLSQHVILGTVNLWWGKKKPYKEAPTKKQFGTKLSPGSLCWVFNPSWDGAALLHPAGGCSMPKAPESWRCCV